VLFSHENFKQSSARELALARKWHESYKGILAGIFRAVLQLTEISMLF
jgi:hypothetical protein